MCKHIRRFAEFSEGKKLNKGELESLKNGGTILYIFQNRRRGIMGKKEEPMIAYYEDAKESVENHTGD